MTVTARSHPSRPSSTLVVTNSAEEGATVITLRGEADLASITVLTDSLARVIDDQQGAVVIDLAGVFFLDTAAVRAIVRASLVLGNQHRHLSVRTPSRLAMLMLDKFDAAHLVAAAER